MQNIDNIIEKFGIKNELIEGFSLGMVDSVIPNTLTYCVSENYQQIIAQNDNIECVITTSDLAKNLAKKIILADDPCWLFWILHNCVATEEISNSKALSSIHPSAVIHSTAVIDQYNVEIGENSTIEPNVILHSGVSIGKNCRIRSNATIGFDGFEHKRTSKGMVSVVHNGLVIIKDDVEIGTLNSVAKGFRWRNTVIGNGTKTDSLVHIAHGVNIGINCLIAACSEISGSVTIGNNVWLGPNSSIINNVRLGNDAFIGIGAVVTKSVSENIVVGGNPARVLKRKISANQ